MSPWFLRPVSGEVLLSCRLTFRDVAHKHDKMQWNESCNELESERRAVDSARLDKSGIASRTVPKLRQATCSRDHLAVCKAHYPSLFAFLATLYFKRRRKRKKQ